MSVYTDFFEKDEDDFTNEDTYSIVFDELITETDEAWLLDIDCEEMWFPKACCRIEDNYITMPVWLADDKGLI